MAIDGKFWQSMAKFWTLFYRAACKFGGFGRKRQEFVNYINSVFSEGVFNIFPSKSKFPFILYRLFDVLLIKTTKNPWHLEARDVNTFVCEVQSCNPKRCFLFSVKGDTTGKNTIWSLNKLKFVLTCFENIYYN